jgi:hypothetical protein
VSGSSMIPIITPIVALLAMAVWLGMIFYADGHPGQRGTKSTTVPGNAPATPVDHAPPPPLEHEELPSPAASADMEPEPLLR